MTTTYENWIGGEVPEILLSLWYISFASDAGPIGVTVVRATSAEDAFMVATKQGLNPGGEAAIVKVLPKGAKDAMMWLDRLVSPEEVLAFGGHRCEAPQGATIVCGSCN